MGSSDGFFSPDSQKARSKDKENMECEKQWLGRSRKIARYVYRHFKNINNEVYISTKFKHAWALLNASSHFSVCSRWSAYDVMHKIFLTHTLVYAAWMLLRITYFPNEHFCELYISMSKLLVVSSFLCLTQQKLFILTMVHTLNIFLNGICIIINVGAWLYSHSQSNVIVILIRTNVIVREWLQ